MLSELVEEVALRLVVGFCSSLSPSSGRASLSLVRRRQYEVVRGGSWFEGVRSSSCGARVVRRRQSASVGVGAFGCGSVCAEETRAARIQGADGTQGSPLSLFLFHLGFCVCVCREASSAK